MSYLVIGAGLCGLTLAQELSQNKKDVVILEKSRGVGGRMATRRTDSGKFDHGAQFYSLKAPIESAHQKWLEAGLTQKWFTKDGMERYSAPGGLTSLAKSLCQGLNTKLEKKVTSLERSSQGWKVSLEDHTQVEAKFVVLTCPLPQSLEILRRSEISFDPSLEKIMYAKALVGLFENPTKFPLPKEGFLENPGAEIFTCASQRAKGMQHDGITVVMNPEFSEQHFEKSDEDIFRLISAAMLSISPGFDFKEGQAKKWRYSHPLSHHHSPFYSVAENLLLAGDAFGGPNLNATAASGAAVAKFILNQS